MFVFRERLRRWKDSSKPSGRTDVFPTALQNPSHGMIGTNRDAANFDACCALVSGKTASKQRKAD